MQNSNSVNDNVRQINEILRGFGKEAVQEIKMTKDGKTIGQVKYGYKPQWCFDAVNQVMGAENWRYELVKEEIFESQSVAEVKLFIKTDGEWLCKGSQKGQSQIVKGNVGDAQKGAITNALLKCMSILSIGSDAYKGLLEPVFKGNNRPAARPAAKPASQKPAAAQTPPPSDPPAAEAAQASSAPAQETPAPEVPQNQTDSTGLPMIAGVTYEQRDDVVVATGTTFDKKDLLKAAGFKWDGTEKVWAKPATA